MSNAPTATNVKVYALSIFEAVGTSHTYTRVHVRLTVGSAAGAIRELFSKVQAIDAKHGKFDLVLCTGDFFGPLKDEDEEYTEEDDVVQLLNGSLDGECLSLSVLDACLRLLCSTFGMLHYAR